MQNYFINEQQMESVRDMLETLRAGGRRLHKTQIDGQSGIILDQNEFNAIIGDIEVQFVRTQIDGLLKLVFGNHVNEHEARQTKSTAKRSARPARTPKSASTENSDPSSVQSSVKTTGQIFAEQASPWLKGFTVPGVYFEDNFFASREPRKSGEGVCIIGAWPKVLPESVAPTNFNLQAAPSWLALFKGFLYNPSYLGTSLFYKETQNTVGEVFETEDGGLDVFLLFNPSIETVSPVHINQFIKETLLGPFVDFYTRWKRDRTLTRNERIDNSRSEFVNFAHLLEKKQQAKYQQDIQQIYTEQKKQDYNYQILSRNLHITEQTLCMCRQIFNERMTRIRTALENLYENSSIQRAYIDSTTQNLTVDTKEIVMEDPETGEEHALGSYTIRLSWKQNSNIEILKKSGRSVNQKIHPYLHNNVHDLTPIMGTLVELIAEDQLDQVFILVVRFLSTAIPNHPWNLYIKEWPKSGE